MNKYLDIENEEKDNSTIIPRFGTWKTMWVMMPFTKKNTGLFCSPFIFYCVTASPLSSDFQNGRYWNWKAIYFSLEIICSLQWKLLRFFPFFSKFMNFIRIWLVLKLSQQSYLELDRTFELEDLYLKVVYSINYGWQEWKIFN